MSTIIMSHCWPIDGISPAQKAVLISLANEAKTARIAGGVAP